MAPGEVGDHKSGPPIAPTSFQKKAAYKSSRSGNGTTPERSAFAVAHHLPCAQRCVTLFDHLPVMTCVAHRVVQQITLNGPHSRALVHRDRFMNQPFSPTSTISSKQSQLIIRIPTAAANPPPHIHPPPSH